MDITVNTEGMEALAQRLKALSMETRYKGGRFAGRKAANVIATAAKARALHIDNPATRENIAANLTVRWNSRKFKRDGTLAFRIGVRGGAKTREGSESNPGGDTWHWRLLEYGTEKMAARPFMRPALEESAQTAINVFISEYQKAINRAIKKAAKSGKTA